MSRNSTPQAGAVAHQRINIGGIHTVVYNLEAAKRSDLPITVLIATHGRGEDQFGLTKLVEGTYKKINELENQAGNSGKKKRELIIVTLDQRNHGERKVDDISNQGFEANDRHAVDMCAMYHGTARDISFLIDFIPAYLFPEAERTIEKFAVTGVSLGGHATWIVLRDEPRVTIGIPIIGCPDYYSMIKERIARKPPSNGQRTLVGPAWPPSFAELIAKRDACAVDYTSHDPTVNPYINKQILILGGGDDKLVPPKFGQKMYDEMYVGEKGAKDMIIQDGVGHATSNEMIERVGEWIWRYGLSGAEPSAPVQQASQL